MNRYDIQKRTMKMALEVIKLTKLFPNCHESKVISYQIIKCSTSTAANYRAAGRAKSARDFIAKLCIVEEECDETLFWLDFSVEAKIISLDQIQTVRKETSEILAMIVSSIKTARKNLNS